MILEGTTHGQPRRHGHFNHPKFGKIHFALETSKSARPRRFRRSSAGVLGRAGNDADKRMEAAQWALRHGLLPQFYSAVDKALEANPQHSAGLLVKKLKAEDGRPIGRLAKQERGACGS